MSTPAPREVGLGPHPLHRHTWLRQPSLFGGLEGFDELAEGA